MNLYHQCLLMAEERRNTQILNRSKRRLERLKRFFAARDKGRWRRQGNRVVWE